MISSQVKNLSIYSGIPFSQLVTIQNDSGGAALLQDFYAHGQINISGANAVPLAPENLRIYRNAGILEVYFTPAETLVFPAGTHSYAVYLHTGQASYLAVSGAFTVYEKAMLLNDNTAWEDLRVAATAAKAAGIKDPGFAKFLDNGAGSTGVYIPWFDAAAEEELFFTLQLPHAYLQGSTIRPHIHWVPKTAPAAGQFVVWGLEYTWANIGSVFSATTVIKSSATSAEVATAQGDGTLVASKHYLTLLPDIAGTGKTLSSQLIARIFRDAGNSDDDYPYDAGLLEIDFHAQFDGFGSPSEYEK